jgi:hypothetical protein
LKTKKYPFCGFHVNASVEVCPSYGVALEIEVLSDNPSESSFSSDSNFSSTDDEKEEFSRRRFSPISSKSLSPQSIVDFSEFRKARGDDLVFHSAQSFYTPPNYSPQNNLVDPYQSIRAGQLSLLFALLSCIGLLPIIGALIAIYFGYPNKVKDSIAKRGFQLGSATLGCHILILLIVLVL